MKNLFYPVFLLLFFCSCNSNRSSQKEGDSIGTDEMVEVTKISYPFVIEKSQPGLSVEDIYLQDVAQVRYLKLQTNESSLLPAKRMFSGVHLTDTDLFISFGLVIYRFDHAGNFKNKIGNRGQGPQEFGMGGEFSVCEETQQVYLLDCMQRRMLVFGYDGKMARSFRLKSGIARFMVVDEEIGIGCINEPHDGDRVCLFSLKDGETKSVLLDPKLVNSRNLMLNLSLFSQVRTYDDFIYLPMASTDTVYAYNKEQRLLEPRFIWTPLNETIPEDEVKKVPYVQFDTDSYTSILLNDRPMPSFTYWINKKSGDIKKVVLKDKNKGKEATVFGWGTNSRNLVFDILEMGELKDLYEEGKLSGELKEIVENSKEDDNPILLFADFTQM